MVSAATPHRKLLECSCVTAFPRTRFNPFSLKPPCPSVNLRHTHFTSSSISLQSKFKIVPLVAQTSDWPQQEENTELQNETDEGIEANATDSFSRSDGGEGEDEDSYAEPPEEAKLFVGNLHYDVDSEKLAQLFDQAGVVEISEVIYNRQTDQSRGFAFVTMSTVEEADKAVEMFNRYELNGRLLTVNKASPVGSQPERVPKLHEAAFRIYIGNLPWQVDNSRLEQVFSEHGKVVDARVVHDRETGRSRGFGFVTMSTEAEVNDAIAALDGQNLDGRAIRVNIAEERPRRSF